MPELQPILRADPGQPLLGVPIFVPQLPGVPEWVILHLLLKQLLLVEQLLQPLLGLLLVDAQLPTLPKRVLLHCLHRRKFQLCILQQLVSLVLLAH